MQKKIYRSFIFTLSVTVAFVMGWFWGPASVQSGPCILEAKVDNMAFVYCPGVYEIRIGGLEIRDIKFETPFLQNDRHGAQKVVIRVSTR